MCSRASAARARPTPPRLRVARSSSRSTTTILVASGRGTTTKQRSWRRQDERMLEALEHIADEQTERRTGWEGLIVLCAANNMDDVKLADRHMAECLTAHAPVLYVDPPMS